MLDTQATRRSLPDWLSRLDALQLECDGLSRVVSRLLWDAGVEHRLRSGCLTDLRRPLPADSVGQVLHFWVELEPEGDGEPLIIDLRARMWMGAGAPHGVLTYSEVGEFLYKGADYLTMPTIPMGLLSAMAGCELSGLVSLDEVRATDWWAL